MFTIDFEDGAIVVYIAFVLKSKNNSTPKGTAEKGNYNSSA